MPTTDEKEFRGLIKSGFPTDELLGVETTDNRTGDATMYRMPNNTHEQMTASGLWAKVGRKHYRHVSGIEIKNDGSLWVIVGKRLGYTSLWAARDAVQVGTHN
jgi:hypothetical protein